MDNFNYQAYIKSGKIHGESKQVISESQEVTEKKEDIEEVGKGYFKKEHGVGKKDLKGIAQEIMINAKNCSLITIDSLGIAHARVMDPFLPEENFTVWMATNPKSLKVRQIKDNGQVTLFYFDQKSVSYVTLQGVARIVN